MYICTPAFIYLLLCSIQIILDFINGLNNIAFIKIFVTICITILLDYLCKIDLGIISWIIVLVPFLFMTLIVSIILYFLGLDIITGKSIEVNTNTNNKPVNYYGISSPPIPPWFLPNTTVTNPETNNEIFLLVTKPNIKSTQIPGNITVMPIQNIPYNYSTDPQYTN
jgi:hypothetical protein